MCSIDREDGLVSGTAAVGERLSEKHYRPPRPAALVGKARHVRDGLSDRNYCAKAQTRHFCGLDAPQASSRADGNAPVETLRSDLESAADAMLSAAGLLGRKTGAHTQAQLARRIRNERARIPARDETCLPADIVDYLVGR
ncbi:MAG: hypothetical protein ACP5R5_08595 [Armatimonadota bacterium]